MLQFFFLLALQSPFRVVFYSPLAGFSLLAYEDNVINTWTKLNKEEAQNCDYHVIIFN